jgi:glycosyltransferase involved in cell wall biosynthesis
MEKKNPLVSVVIPVYNGEKYLHEAIESVLAQTYPNTEIIVIDDGSTDRSAEIAQKLSSVVKYHYQSNAGTGAARNHGVEVARGSFFSFLDADDLWLQDKLNIQMSALRNKPETEIVFGHVKQFYSPELDEVTRSKIRCPNEVMPGYLPYTMVIQRDAFFRVGLFESNWRVGQDVSWIMRAQEQKLKMLMLPDLIYMRRLHKDNKGITHRPFIKDRVRILKAALDRRRKMDNSDPGNHALEADAREVAGDKDARALAGTPPAEQK